MAAWLLIKARTTMDHLSRSLSRNSKKDLYNQSDIKCGIVCPTFKRVRPPLRLYCQKLFNSNFHKFNVLCGLSVGGVNMLNLSPPPPPNKRASASTEMLFRNFACNCALSKMNYKKNRSHFPKSKSTLNSICGSKLNSERLLSTLLRLDAL